MIEVKDNVYVETSESLMMQQKEWNVYDKAKNVDFTKYPYWLIVDHIDKVPEGFDSIEEAIVSVTTLDHGTEDYWVNENDVYTKLNVNFEEDCIVAHWNFRNKITASKSIEDGSCVIWPTPELIKFNGEIIDCKKLIGEN